MKKCAFTIVAKNYIGLGQILGQSVAKYHDDVDFYIVVADGFEEKPAMLPANVILAKEALGYDSKTWTDMAFKYNLTEFCTSIKPASFQYMFDKGYDKAIYLDPDIYLFSPLTEAYERLDTYDVALTPQIAGIHVDYQGEHPEWAMNVNGIFNLGFCAMRNTQLSATVLAWWRLRLQKEAFADRNVGDFTDQKWMDWMPGLLGNEHLYVFHNLGMNMAPWNYFERQLFMRDGQIMVKYRTDDNPYREDRLVFIHFAGYDYKKMKQGIISRKRIENLKEYEDLSFATDIYGKAIVENQQVFDGFINNQYSYGTFDNGTPIQSFHRRLYHGYTEKHTVDNPFATTQGSFYSLIKRKGMVEAGKKENIDKLSQRNIPDIEGKRRMIALLFSMLYKLFGYKRYVLFVKSLYNYCRPELHTFLINKK